MSRRRKTSLLILFSVLILLPLWSAGKGMPAILSMKERASVVDEWLKIRLDKDLLEIMRRENFDMWIIICQEYNEDPVYLSLVPFTSLSARRLIMLVFYDKGEEGVERIAVSRYGIGNIYKAVWEPEKMDQWECLAKVVKEREPQRIGINESETFAFGDGLSSSLKKKLLSVFGPESVPRLHSAERLAVGWLERRIPQELEVYPHIVSIAHRIITEAFSAQVITPGITTTEDVVWWIRERIRDLKLTTWFQPSVSIQRPKNSPHKGNVIHRGNLLHCDVGITYLGLNTDTQEHAYVLRADEEGCPEGLQDAMALGNRLQDILIAEFKEGRTGNEILASALREAKAEGLKASIYTHPLGYHGHGAGPIIGLWDRQQGVPGRGDYPLFYDTCHSIELNIRMNVPEWGGEEVRIALEQDAAFTREGVSYLDGRQTHFHLIR